MTKHFTRSQSLQYKLVISIKKHAIIGFTSAPKTLQKIYNAWNQAEYCECNEKFALCPRKINEIIEQLQWNRVYSLL